MLQKLHILMRYYNIQGTWESPSPSPTRRYLYIRKSRRRMPRWAFTSDAKLNIVWLSLKRQVKVFFQKSRKVQIFYKWSWHEEEEESEKFAHDETVTSLQEGYTERDDTYRCLYDEVKEMRSQDTMMTPPQVKLSSIHIILASCARLDKMQATKSIIKAPRVNLLVA